MADKSSNAGPAAAPAKNSIPLVTPGQTENDDEAPQKVDRRTLPNGASPGVPAGLQEFATKRLETPREMLARTLGVGETVSSSFECYFQSDRISRAEWWFLVITSCGFYIINKWIKAIKDYICCSKDTSIHYSRGTLVITNLGRVISWQHSYDQDPPDPNAKKGSAAAKGLPYLIQHSKKVYNVRDVRQMSLQLSSPEMGGGILDFFPCLAGLLQCCGMAEFECGVTLTFHSFDDSFFAASDPSGLVTAGAASSYAGLIGAIFGIFSPGVSSASASTTLTIISANDDQVHNPKGKSDPSGTITDLAALQAKVVKAMKISSSFQGAADPEAAAIFSKDDAAVGTTIVDDSGTVTIPRTCVPLMDGEFVIASQSFVYKLNFDDWVRIISTAGFAYCTSCFGAEPIRNKRFQRAVLIMTNVRIISISICERAGAIPTHMTNFSFNATSYFPGEVRAGTTTCDGVSRIDSSLLCDGGRLTVSLHNVSNFCTFPLNLCPKTCPVTSLDPKLIQFAKRLQNVAAKSIPLNVKLRKFVVREVAEKIGMLDAGALTAVVGRAASKAADALVAVGNDEADRNVFSDFEKEMLPLCEGETLVNRYKSSNRYMPCCKVNGQYCCSSGAGLLVMCCTCGVRPLTSSESSIVTSHAIYHLGQTRTYPWPCVKSLVPPKQLGFVVAWAPIRAFRGQSFSYRASGLLPIHEKGFFGGKYKKTPGPSTYSFSIQFEEGFTFVYTGSKDDRNWLVDDNLNYELHVFDQVQLTLLGAGAQPLELSADDIEEGGGSTPICGGAITLAMANLVGGGSSNSSVEAVVAVPV